MAHRRETSAGGVVVRRRGGRIEVALAEQRDRVSGERTRRLPKGKPERGETLEQTALREVAEETGLTARVIAPLGAQDYVYRDAGGERVAKRVHFFLMELVAGEAHPRDGEMERIHWCPLEEAGPALTFETERAAVARARERL
jgi:8-oxo-dGTP pyrophosphatase MutT (NUDIX family)